ncbi:MAG TPA: aldehyde dehydrogenase family protein [Steroidobacteraceae bacterium]|nr:aldehyde dehydrogenase family protein [Steroidobacteraceae bacterium]
MQNDLSILSREARAALDRRPAHYIGGAWVAAAESIPVVDPSSGQQISTIARGGRDSVDSAVQAANRAFRSEAWRGLGPVGRERLLHKLADLIESRAELIAQIETVDNGMPLWFAANLDVGGSVEVYRYFAGWPSKLTGDTLEVSAPPGLGKYFGFTRREPVGVVGAIIPWNVPFMMAAWKLAPALAAGCTVVLKPAEDTSLSALLLAELIEQAGFPPGVVNVVTGYGREAGEALVQHPGVGKISFTGSTVTGRRIGALAGETLKKVTLELGGKSPTILFEDADLDAAVPGAATSIFLNSGQICVAGSRLYVHARIYDEVLGRLARHIATVKVGPGFGADTFMGPLINARQRERVQGYITGARASGCEVIAGADLGQAAGFYVSPTVISGARQDDRLTQEEVFGPVLGVYRFNDLEEAVAAANGTAYGLAASVWSKSIDTALAMAERLECGKVTVNAGGFPYPGLPEGGYKSSGYGRDLGREAVEQCLQSKTVMVRTG